MGNPRLEGHKQTRLHNSELLILNKQNIKINQQLNKKYTCVAELGQSHRICSGRVMQVNWGNLIGDASDIFHMFRRRKSFAVL